MRGPGFRNTIMLMNKRGRRSECRCRDTGVTGALPACVGYPGCRWAGGALERRRDLHYATVSLLVSGERAIRRQIVTHGLVLELENRWVFLPHGGQWRPGIAVYRATGSSGTARAFGIQVLTLEFSVSDVLVADVTTF